MIFLTGSTGFLGREILGRLLVQRPEQEFCLMVRPSQEADPRSRIKKILIDTFGDSLAKSHLDRIHIVTGDLELENFGLGRAEFSRLASDVSSIFHCAASTCLAQGVESARKSNVGSTSQVLSLAREASTKNPNFELHHLSTAYVAGDTKKTALESELRLDVPFKNGYEQSKAESESLVRAASSEFMTRIYRPSMIVGDSVTGRTSSFNVIYIPARYLARGLFSIIPAHENTPHDVVPVDYVADAVVDLSAKNISKSGKCFHLCAGEGRETNLSEIIEAIIHAVSLYSQRKLISLPRPIIVSPELIFAAANSVKKIEERFTRGVRVLQEILHLVPYMSRNPQFDTSNSRELFMPAPLFTNYAEQIFGYCIQTNWGKHDWKNPLNLKDWFDRDLQFYAA